MILFALEKASHHAIRILKLPQDSFTGRETDISPKPICKKCERATLELNSSTLLKALIDYSPGQHFDYKLMRDPEPEFFCQAAFRLKTPRNCDRNTRFCCCCCCAISY